MFVKHNKYTSVYGGDEFYALGLEEVTEAQWLVCDTGKEYLSKRLSFWIITKHCLTDIIHFIETQDYLPDFILCPPNNIRMFSRMPAFQNVTLINSDAPVEQISRAVLMSMIATSGMMQEIMILPIPFTSLKQKIVARMFLDGQSPKTCARALNIGTKTVSNYKRALMNRLNVYTTQELLFVLRINEHFSGSLISIPPVAHPSHPETILALARQESRDYRNAINL